MTTQRAEHLFRAAWEKAIAAGPPSRAIQGVRKIEYRTFVEKVFAADASFVSDFVRSAYAGDVYVFPNAYSPSVLRELKDAAHRWAQKRPSEEPKLVDGVGDYRSRRDWHIEEKGYGYSSTYDMMHFYRWNGDAIGAFALFAEQYRLLRVVSGFGPDDIAKNLPRDGYVDRVELSHYPTGIGGVGFHTDPLAAQRFQLTVTLSEFGTDFKKGGFACGGKDGSIVQIEPLGPPGSVFGFLPTVCHAVEPIDPDLPVDWDGPTGRWYASTVMVTSAAVDKREITVPVAGFPTLREQIARHRQDRAASSP